LHKANGCFHLAYFNASIFLLTVYRIFIASKQIDATQLSIYRKDKRQNFDFINDNGLGRQSGQRNYLSAGSGRRKSST
jgi:hypothetical protein